jgi:hypothetical protein
MNDPTEADVAVQIPASEGDLAERWAKAIEWAAKLRPAEKARLWDLLSDRRPGTLAAKLTVYSQLERGVRMLAKLCLATLRASEAANPSQAGTEQAEAVFSSPVSEDYHNGETTNEAGGDDDVEHDGEE